MGRCQDRIWLGSELAFQARVLSTLALSPPIPTSISLTTGSRSTCCLVSKTVPALAGSRSQRKAWTIQSFRKSVDFVVRQTRVHIPALPPTSWGPE